PSNVEEERVAAMSAAMLSLGERIAQELQRGNMEEVYIRGEEGLVLLTAIGRDAVLTTLARSEAKLGLMLLEMRRTAAELEPYVA
ncbi:MAG: roadblock/LC7 domain-containing protein, partial [Anaerolineales bacterium]|nr:roadblock/LC7 domain-containing protein [Anaerolineales bacterium]